MGGNGGGLIMRDNDESPRAAATAPRARNAVGNGTPPTPLPSPKKWRGRKSIVEIDDQRITVGGQELRTLLALVAAGSRGVAAQEVSSWAYRLAAYCHRLRRYGLVISTSSEPHGGGWHARYRLECPVKLHPRLTA